MGLSQEFIHYVKRSTRTGGSRPLSWRTLVPKCRRRAEILAHVFRHRPVHFSCGIDYERVICVAQAKRSGPLNALTKLQNNVNQTRVQTLMLKISVKDEESQKQLLLEVEGRLAGPWVEELERSWQTERQRTSSERILVRLAHVSFIDEAGKELLSKMFQAGAQLEGSGCMVRAIIARITGAAFPAHDCQDEGKKIVAAQSGGGQGNEHT